MRNFLFFKGVRTMPLQFNLWRFRVSMPVILTFLGVVVFYVLVLVIGNQFLEDTPYAIFTGVVIFTALVTAAMLLWWVAHLTGLSSLPVEKQLRLLVQTAKLPVWTGLDFIDSDKKEQIR